MWVDVEVFGMPCRRCHCQSNRVRGVFSLGKYYRRRQEAVYPAGIGAAL